ncbi:unnamed protein product [Lathyrus oleraceus]
MSKDFLRISQKYMCMFKYDMFVILETRSDSKKLCKKMQNMGFDKFDFSENKCYSGGDFNDILMPNEKKCGIPVSINSCSLFMDCINSRNLLEMDTLGHKYTCKGPIQHGGTHMY